MKPTTILTAAIVLIAVLVAGVWGRALLRREKPHAGFAPNVGPWAGEPGAAWPMWRAPGPPFVGSGVRENYGEPPGVARAVSLEELGSRGWPEFAPEYSATTTGAMMHLVELSA